MDLKEKKRPGLAAAYGDCCNDSSSSGVRRASLRPTYTFLLASLYACWYAARAGCNMTSGFSQVFLRGELDVGTSLVTLYNVSYGAVAAAVLLGWMALYIVWPRHANDDSHGSSSHSGVLTRTFTRDAVQRVWHAWWRCAVLAAALLGPGLAGALLPALLPGTYAAHLVGRIIHAVADAAFMVVGMALARLCFCSVHKPMAVTAITAGSLSGDGISPMVGVLLYSYLGVQYAYYAQAAIFVLAGLMWLLFTVPAPSSVRLPAGSRVHAMQQQCSPPGAGAGTGTKEALPPPPPGGDSCGKQAGAANEWRRHGTPPMPLLPLAVCCPGSPAEGRKGTHAHSGGSSPCGLSAASTLKDALPLPEVVLSLEPAGLEATGSAQKLPEPEVFVSLEVTSLDKCKGGTPRSKAPAAGPAASHDACLPRYCTEIEEVEHPGLATPTAKGEDPSGRGEEAHDWHDRPTPATLPRSSHSSSSNSSSPCTAYPVAAAAPPAAAPLPRAPGAADRLCSDVLCCDEVVPAGSCGSCTAAPFLGQAFAEQPPSPFLQQGQGVLPEMDLEQQQQHDLQQQQQHGLQQRQQQLCDAAASDGLKARQGCRVCTATMSSGCNAVGRLHRLARTVLLDADVSGELVMLIVYEALRTLTDLVVPLLMHRAARGDGYKVAIPIAGEAAGSLLLPLAARWLLVSRLGCGPHNILLFSTPIMCSAALAALVLADTGSTGGAAAAMLLFGGLQTFGVTLLYRNLGAALGPGADADAGVISIVFALTQALGHFFGALAVAPSTTLGSQLASVGIVCAVVFTFQAAVLLRRAFVHRHDAVCGLLAMALDASVHGGTAGMAGRGGAQMV